MRCFPERARLPTPPGRYKSKYIPLSASEVAATRIPQCCRCGGRLSACPNVQHSRVDQMIFLFFINMSWMDVDSCVARRCWAHVEKQLSPSHSSSVMRHNCSFGRCKIQSDTSPVIQDDCRFSGSFSRKELKMRETIDDRTRFVAVLLKMAV